MEQIKALLYLDFRRNYEIIIILFLVWVVGFVWILLGFAPIFIMVFSIGIISSDDRKDYNRMQRHVDILPISVKEIVVSRYLFKLAIIFLSSILAYTLQYSSGTVTFLMDITIDNAIIFISAALTVASFMTPINYYKNTLALSSILGTLMGYFIAISIVSGRISFENININVVFAVSIIMFLASIPISINVYKLSDI